MLSSNPTTTVKSDQAPHQGKPVILKNYNIKDLDTIDICEKKFLLKYLGVRGVHSKELTKFQKMKNFEHFLNEIFKNWEKKEVPKSLRLPFETTEGLKTYAEMHIKTALNYVEIFTKTFGDFTGVGDYFYLNSDSSMVFKLKAYSFVRRSFFPTYHLNNKLVEDLSDFPADHLISSIGSIEFPFYEENGNLEKKDDDERRKKLIEFHDFFTATATLPHEEAFAVKNRLEKRKIELLEGGRPVKNFKACFYYDSPCQYFEQCHHMAPSDDKVIKIERNYPLKD